VHMAGPNNQEVPAPWSCTYDVASQQVEPVNAAASDQSEQTTSSAAPDAQPVASGNNPFADGAGDSQAQADGTAEEELPGERFPATRLDELTVPDVNESSVEEINYAVNEMYARHGAQFKDKKTGKEFSEFAWYTPNKTQSNAEQEFSDLEKQNLKVLQQCRDAKLAASRRRSSPVRTQRVREETTGEKVLRGLQMWQDAGAPLPPHP
jgi:YARHG domain